MSLLNQLNDDMKTAMKAGDKSRLSALRMLVSAVRYVGIDSGEMTDDKVIGVLQKEAKKRRESIVAFTEGNRPESALQEKNELKIIEEYLPKMMDEDMVKAKIVEILGRGSYANIGLAIGAVMSELKGQADGAVVSKYVRASFVPPTSS